jgi:mRNA interferase RelE/StbE
LTYSLDWEPAAVGFASRFLADDPQGLLAIMAAVDALKGDPRPATAFPLGTTGMLRLRRGRYRVVYQVDEDTRIITVMHVGRAD